MDSLNLNLPAKNWLEIHYKTFESIGFNIESINQDLDYFSVKVKNPEANSDQINGMRIEPLLFGSLELFSRLAFNSGYYQSSNYFINLYSKPLFSKLYMVEIDYLMTSQDAVFLEAYCYEENGLLIAKGGSVILKE
jgi:hypothetical protein